MHRPLSALLARRRSFRVARFAKSPEVGGIQPRSTVAKLSLVVNLRRRSIKEALRDAVGAQGMRSKICRSRRWPGVTVAALFCRSAGAVVRRGVRRASAPIGSDRRASRHSAFTQWRGGHQRFPLMVSTALRSIRARSSGDTFWSVAAFSAQM